jgi:hypothetical protein
MYCLNKLAGHFCVILFVLFVPTFTYSQINISGVVADAKDKTPLKWAVVKANLSTDSNVVSATETIENGVFTLTNLNPGEYVLSFSYTGYTSRKMKISLTAESKFIDTIKLSSSEYKTDVVNEEIKFSIIT